MIATTDNGKTYFSGFSGERANRIAESLQRVLLRTPPVHALPGLSVEVFYEPALDEAAVGGDSFDIVSLGDGRIAVSVLDASGKGLSAAERVMEIRFALRAFLREHAQPAMALSRLNDFVCDCQTMGHHADGAFATLSLAILNSSSGSAVILCAGGEPPVALRADGEAELIDSCGPALGFLRGQEYTQTIVQLAAGDSLILVTDGITEARNFFTSFSGARKTSPFLGLEGVARLAAESLSSEQRLAQVGKSIFEAARRFAGGTFFDDVCLMVARREESGG